MSLLNLFRFFRPIPEDLNPLSKLATSIAERTRDTHATPATLPDVPPANIPSPPPTISRPITPFTGTKIVQVWLHDGNGSFPTQVHGESYYPVEIAAAIGDRKPWKEECVFQVLLLPEKNIHDKNAVAIYRGGGGQVGHLTRDCASRWRPVIDELFSVAGVVPAWGIMLDITLGDIRAELAKRRRTPSSIC
jgi:hypothetical protein